ncbi:MAG: PLP-dependent aminotransferase family protein [Rhodospirillaceae bacterium]|nr:PLP-dependent aminotransferase family protein [Rhodospirillaceae bacterium]
MTNWTPDLDVRPGPRYLAIAVALGEAIARGELRPGDRLPTHRDLAQRLGVTVPTVSRAYREASRRGYLSGEVGRGTFVRGAVQPKRTPGQEREEHGLIDFDMNRPTVDAPHAGYLAESLARLARSPELADMLRYQPNAGLPSHRAAGAAWMAKSGLDAQGERVVVTSGGKHSLFVVLHAIAKPGDTILTEELSWPGIRSVAKYLDLRLEPVKLDDDGLVPDDLERACREHKPKALLCTPTAQNPTVSILPAARRRRIAEIARSNDIAIIEDEVYGPLIDEPPPPVATFAPERTFYLTSLSKVSAPGLRVGFVLAPQGQVGRVAQGVGATTIFTPPLMVEIGAQWIASGTIQALVDWQRREVSERAHLLRQILGNGIKFRIEPHAMHTWIQLPKPWHPADIVEAGRRRGLSLSQTEAFCVGIKEPDAIRLALCGPVSRTRYEEGLRRLADALAAGPEFTATMV